MCQSSINNIVMKRIAAQRPIRGITKAQFEKAMECYAVAVRKEEQLQRQVEEEVNEVQEKYSDEFLSVAQAKHIAFEVVESYCIENKKKLFGRSRSIGTIFAIAGFRLGTPQLRTMKGSDWKKVLKELKAKLPGYVRKNEEPAKDLLLADRYTEHVAPLLVEMGIQVVQDELFYIETKKAA